MTRYLNKVNIIILIYYYYYLKNTFRFKPMEVFWEVKRMRMIKSIKAKLNNEESNLIGLMLNNLKQRCSRTFPYKASIARP